MRRKLSIIQLLFLAFSGSQIAMAQEIMTETRIVTEAELLKLQEDSARVEATPIQHGVMTPRQREHSKLDVYKDKHGANIMEEMSNSQPNQFLQFGCGSNETYDRDYPTSKLQITLKALAAASDAVVIGQVVEQASQLTEDDHFLFTDYQLELDRVLKECPTAPLKVPGKITVTRIGGTVLLEGHVIEAINYNFPLFHKGFRYLLFLKYLPVTDSYRVVNFFSSYWLIRNRVIRFNQDYRLLRETTADVKTDAGESIDIEMFIAEVSSAIREASESKQ